MSTPITFNGVSYSVPAYNDTGYAQGAGNLSSYLIAISTGTLQQSGGTFALTADANFGTNFGLVAKYFKSVTAGIADAGVIRLAKTDLIEWRNNGGSGNNILGVDTSNNLEWNGNDVLTGSSGGYVSSITGTANQVIASAATGAVTLSTPQDIALASSPTFAAETLTNTSNQLVLGTTRTVTLNAPTPASVSRIVTIPDLSNAYSVVGTEGTQTINGTKTFSTPLTVPSGGTGVGTFTAYSVILAGTTATGAFQNVVGLGASGQVLTSNGAGVIPSWQNAAGTGTVNSGTAGQLAYYATSTNVVSGNTAITTAGTTTPILNVTGSAGAQYLATSTSYQGQLAISEAGASLLLRDVTTPREIINYNFTTHAVTTDVNPWTFSGVATFAAKDTHSLGLDITGHTSNRALNASTSLASNSYEMLLLNSSTTGAAGAYFHASVDSSSTGDPFTLYQITGSNRFAVGIDNSDSDKLKITHNGDTPSAGTEDVVISNATGAVAIRGSSTNDSATAGFYGEVLEATQTTFTNTPATGVVGDVTSLTLSAGDWLVTGMVTLKNNGATVTNWIMGIGTVTGNNLTGVTDGTTRADGVPTSATSTQMTVSVPSWHTQLSGSTTYYLKVDAAFTGGPPQAAGRITAVRIR